jgi:hypothetical protein
MLAAGAVLLVGQPAPAQARMCEDICADKVVENCEVIDSVKCNAYILGCLSGCSVGKIISWFR